MHILWRGAQNSSHFWVFCSAHIHKWEWVRTQTYKALSGNRAMRTVRCFCIFIFATCPLTLNSREMVQCCVTSVAYLCIHPMIYIRDQFIREVIANFSCWAVTHQLGRLPYCMYASMKAVALNLYIQHTLLDALEKRSAIELLNYSTELID